MKPPVSFEQRRSQSVTITSMIKRIRSSTPPRDLYGYGLWNLRPQEREEIARCLELMSIPRPRVAGNKNLQPDWNAPLVYCSERHLEKIAGVEKIPSTWRMKERMKTVSVALVLCLRVGIDPPDIVKTHPYARLQCWIDPQMMNADKALTAIGTALQKQYERWQPRARYRCSLDPTVEDVKKLCSSLRRNAKEERVLFHYNGHGVPRPTENGEIWVFDRGYTQYIPLSIAELMKWMGAPSLYVYDCSNAGMIVESFLQYAKSIDEEYREVNEKKTQSQLCRQPNPFGQELHPPDLYNNCIHLAACSKRQILPMNPELPADLFTSCLTTPIRMALRWYVLQNKEILLPSVTIEMVEKMPGVLNDRRTMLGELNWILTAITDTIAWNTLPRDLFQKLFRQDLLVASLFRNFLLAERIMRAYGVQPVSFPELPETFENPMWQAWDYALDMSLSQLPKILAANPAPTDPTAQILQPHTAQLVQHKAVPFFAEQLTAFHVWLMMGPPKRKPPEQLPIVLQVLLSQVHRLRALELLSNFLDLGPWAVSLALSVGIFPYVLKLLQSNARELRPLLVYIWAKILAVDDTCQADLLRDEGHKYFLAIVNDASMVSEERVAAIFVITCLVKNFSEAQDAALQENAITSMLLQINDQHSSVRLWTALCLGHLWMNHSASRWCGVRNNAHEKLMDLLTDPFPEVRAAVVLALGTFIGSIPPKDRTEHANTLDHSVAISLLNAVGTDGSPLVRKELLVALQWMVVAFENAFVTVAAAAEEEKVYLSPILPVIDMGALTAGSTLRRIASRDRLKQLVSMSSHSGSPPSTTGVIGRFTVTSDVGSGTLPVDPMRRVMSSSALASQAFRTLTSPVSIPSASTHMRIYQGFEALSNDPFPSVRDMAKKLLKAIKSKVAKSVLVSPTASRLIRDPDSTPTRSAPSSPSTKTEFLPREASKNTSGSSGRLSSPGPGPVIKEADEHVKYNTIHAGAHPSGISAARMMRTGSSSIPTRTPIGRTPRRVSSTTLNVSTSSDEGSDGSQTEGTVKPILTTDFVEWCSKAFSAGKPDKKKFPRQKDALIDMESTRFYMKELRYRKNDHIREESLVQRKRAETGARRIDDQIFLNKNSKVPSVVKFHPYSPHLLVADKDHFSTWDLKNGYLLSTVYNLNPKTSSITGLEIMNPQEGTNSMVLVGSEDGAVRLWADSGYHCPSTTSGLGRSNSFSGLPSSRSFEIDGDVEVSRMLRRKVLPRRPRLISAWQVFSELLPSTRNAGLVLNWSQQSQQLAASGDTRVIRLWDASSELKLVDIPTGADCCVTCLSRLPDDTNLIAAGCGDGSVRLFDVRISPNEARIKTWRDHPSWVVTAVLHDSDGTRPTRIISGCSVPGDVRIWDLRQHEALATHNSSDVMTAMAVHPLANIYACGSMSQFISLYRDTGDVLGVIKYHDGFMGQRIGPVSCLAFHDYWMKLAAGSTDTFVSVYGSKSY